MKNSQPPRSPGRSSGGKEKTGGPAGTILLVDDDESARRHMAEALRRKGYEVLTAGDGEEALALSVGYPGPIGLLITDVMMPVMNGKDLAERLCALRPEIRVLLVSGSVREEVLLDNACTGREYWLAKPFTGSRLVSKVKSILASSRKG